MVAQPLPLLSHLAGLAGPKPPEPAPRTSGGGYDAPAIGRAPAGFRRRRRRALQPRLLRLRPPFRPSDQPEADAATPPPLAPEAVAMALGDARPSVFACLVEGDAMRDALVSDGDTLILEEVTELRSGELVALRLPDDDALRLRRVYPAGERVRLQSEDRRWAGEWYLAEQLRFEGRVVAILRHAPLGSGQPATAQATAERDLFSTALQVRG